MQDNSGNNSRRGQVLSLNVFVAVRPVISGNDTKKIQGEIAGEVVHHE